MGPSDHCLFYNIQFPAMCIKA
uniref:Uncharacterized protein n=1 Tax=Arundo donax TaxID=35708 RepID=A0A0A9HER9_ARUDO